MIRLFASFRRMCRIEKTTSVLRWSLGLRDIAHCSQTYPKRSSPTSYVTASLNDVTRMTSSLSKARAETSEGKSFGEVALLKEDCIRTATVVADNETDLVVIDRALYNRSVRDVLEREYTQKNEFVDTNLLFKNWPARQKKLLVVALKKETAKYGSQVIRQGGPADHMYFLLRGHNHTETPLEALKRKKSHHKLIQMCLLGTNEIIGAIDILLGLPTYLDNAMVTREAEVLVLSRENYSRLFTKKAAQATVATLRERLTMRLYLYIHRSEGLVPPVQSPFLKYLTFLLHDENAVMELRRMKRKEIEEKRGLRHARDEEDTHMSSKEAERIQETVKTNACRPWRVHSALSMKSMLGLRVGWSVAAETRRTWSDGMGRLMASGNVI
ncbi:KAPR-like protein [Mya arenaria]|uniref:KAPR-like protein n=1 Tax=Mya arenaria TaxID=6604 RepID=A0ABY7G1I5_MYAAR|nr:KAPR-like protein [Mya arenaria]